MTQVIVGATICHPSLPLDCALSCLGLRSSGACAVLPADRGVARLVSLLTWLTVAIFPRRKLVVLCEDPPSDVIPDHVVLFPDLSHRVAPGPLLPLGHHRLSGPYNQLIRYSVGLTFSPRLNGTVVGVSQIVSDDLLHLVVTAVVQPRYVLDNWFKLGIHCFLQVLAPEVHAGPCHHYQALSRLELAALYFLVSLRTLSLTEILTNCSL